MGFSVILGDPVGTVMHANNCSFDGTLRGGVITTNGQLFIGSTALPHIQPGVLTSPSGTVTIGYSSPNITIDLAGGGTGIAQVTVDAGQTIVPSGVPANITITGNTVANATNPKSVFVLKNGANSAAIDVQVAAAIAATDITKTGLAAFNSTMFSVDANGFVALSGGGQAIDSIAVQTGTSPIVPTGAGLVTINGATVAAGTNPVRTDGTGANTMAVEVQISQAIASTDATKIGLSNFDSAVFTVDANGFVSTAGGGGFTWSDQSGSFNAAKNHGYFITNTSTATLPTSPSQGDTIIFTVDTTNILTITANTGQVIRIGSAVSAAAGTAANNARGDSVTLVYRSSDTAWIARAVIGTWTVT